MEGEPLKLSAAALKQKIDALDPQKLTVDQIVEIGEEIAKLLGNQDFRSMFQGNLREIDASIASFLSISSSDRLHLKSYKVKLESLELGKNFNHLATNQQTAIIASLRGVVKLIENIKNVRDDSSFHEAIHAVRGKKSRRLSQVMVSKDSKVDEMEQILYELRRHLSKLNNYIDRSGLARTPHNQALMGARAEIEQFIADAEDLLRMIK